MPHVGDARRQPRTRGRGQGRRGAVEVLPCAAGGSARRAPRDAARQHRLKVTKSTGNKVLMVIKVGSYSAVWLF